MKHIRETLIFQKRTCPPLHRMTVTQMERRRSQFRERATSRPTLALTAPHASRTPVASVCVFTIGYCRVNAVCEHRRCAGYVPRSLGPRSRQDNRHNIQIQEMLNINMTRLRSRAKLL
ncbi:PREDICTED: uncharacterized protein LOC106116058 [Papilio xuthus]|uniref:Uncharacterized protein LOC106116058 n=1 Tax=Papilio xuthus TaxID=66420 RepID=A0AAJ6Z4I7_PAPXU|nr:PREDICTED: uncharacterized protein LOC106116058 [Papilio xuthus]